MAVGTSLLLIAVGAVLRFAVHVPAGGFDLHTVGLTLMIVGVVALVISLFGATAESGRRRRVAARSDPDYPSSWSLRA